MDIPLIILLALGVAVLLGPAFVEVVVSGHLRELSSVVSVWVHATMEGDAQQILIYLLFLLFGLLFGLVFLLWMELRRLRRDLLNQPVLRVLVDNGVPFRNDESSRASSSISSVTPPVGGDERGDENNAAGNQHDG